MMDVGPLINVGRLMNEYSIQADQAADGGIALLYLHKGESAARVAAALSAYPRLFDVYRKGHYPAFAHLGNGPRAGDIMLVAKPPTGSSALKSCHGGAGCWASRRSGR